MKRSLLDILRETLSILQFESQKRFIQLVLFYFLSAGLEIAALSLIWPFISILTDASTVHRFAWLQAQLQLTTHIEFIRVAGIGILVLYILKNIFSFYILKFQAHLIFVERQRLSSKILDYFLHAPYLVHLERSPHQLIRMVEVEPTNVLWGILLPLCGLIGELLIVSSIFVFLSYINWQSTLMLVIFLFASFIFYRLFFSKRLQKLGTTYQTTGYEIYKCLNEALLGIKDLKIFRKEKEFHSRFSRAYTNHAESWRDYETYSELPKYFLESLTIAGILVIALFLLEANDGQAISTIPLLGLFGVAFLRLLPSISRIVAFITKIRFNEPSLSLIQEQLKKLEKASGEDNRPTECSRVEFERELKIEDLSFSYPHPSRKIFEHLNYSLPKGKWIGIAGPSGAGKSTLIDLILTLLEGESGKISSDGKTLSNSNPHWLQKIGYVPQNIFFLESTIRENITLGEGDSLSDSDIWEALEKSRLAEFIRSLPAGLDTSIGDRALRLSVGQRQRLGLARALLRKPEILILDEATSGLDEATESEILRELKDLGPRQTIILASHRPTVIEQCEVKITLRNQ